MSERTFADQLKERNVYLHELAVWKELDEHLSKFMDSDANPTKLGIRSKGDTLVVPQSIVGGVRARLSVKIAEVERLIQTIDGTRIVADEKQTAEESKEAKEKGTPNGKAPRRKGDANGN